MRLKKGHYCYKLPKSVYDVLHFRMRIRKCYFSLIRVDEKEVLIGLARPKAIKEFGVPYMYSFKCGKLMICPPPEKAYLAEVHYLKVEKR